jgi:Uma2 family endonuclease
MATASVAFRNLNHRTVADLLRRLGGVPAARVRLQPLPGTATERDVIAVHDRENRLCELVDGTLVDKVMGFDESIYAVLLHGALLEYLKTHDLGKIVGADGMMRIFPGLVRIPDTAFISWERYPTSKRRRGEIPMVVPDLIVEVLSAGNTTKEMARKLDEYFHAGVRMVWYVNPKQRTLRVYTARDRSVLLREDDVLDGGDVLPGFALSIRDWFVESERTSARSPRPKKSREKRD